MARIVEIAPYNSAWPQAYEMYADELTAVFGQNLIALYHVGSTAVPGLPAKPIIDIMPIVQSIDKVDKLTDKMAEIGYVAKGENGINGRRYFRKGSDEHHLAHVHTYEPSNLEVSRHLQFRDYLRAHPAARNAYAELKQGLAQQYRENTVAYTEAKTPFIRSVERIARHWWLQSYGLTTPRLQVIPLTLLQLHVSLRRPLLLEQIVGFPIIPKLFDGAVRNALKMKIGKLSIANEAQFRWYTYWLLVADLEDVGKMGIGLVGFKGEPNLAGIAEIGYGLDSAYERRGYMTEAVQALVDWGLSQPECNGVQADTHKNNLASQKVLQKTGFTFTKETDDLFYWQKL